MKKTFLTLTCVLALCAPAAFAQITLSAAPGAQSASAGGTFNVQISLSITGTTPANFAGFNLWLETVAANSGFFSVSGATSNRSGFTTPAGAVNFPESIMSTGSTHTGFAQNTHSLGFVDTAGGANAVTSPFSNLLIETLSIAIAPGTPNGTYTLFTTGTTSGLRTSSINDSNGNSFDVTNQASFNITVVPEPSAWLLSVLGGTAVAVLSLRHRRPLSTR